jgi:hypothetical protein
MQDIVDMLQALPPAVTPGQAGPDLAAADVARGRRALSQRRRRRLAGVAGTAAVGAAAVVLAATSAPWSAAPAAAGAKAGTAQAGGARPASNGTSTGSTDAQQPLGKLASYRPAEPAAAGDATLVERETGAPGHASINVWDLYADNGEYFFSRTEAGLPAQVQENNNQGDGIFGREVAAATSAAAGNLDAAVLKMAWAPDTTPVPAWLSAQLKNISAGGLQIDNYVWENSEDALIAGSGNPQVRAGVLRLVSALPGITVTHGSADGQPTLTLTAGAAEMGYSGINTTNPKLPAGPAYQEAITINADTGIPLQIAGGPVGQTAVTVSYVVTRVNLADIAAGKF